MKRNNPHRITPMTFIVLTPWALTWFVIGRVVVRLTLG